MRIASTFKKNQISMAYPDILHQDLYYGPLLKNQRAVFPLQRKSMGTLFKSFSKFNWQIITLQYRDGFCYTSA